MTTEAHILDSPAVERGASLEGDSVARSSAQSTTADMEHAVILKPDLCGKHAVRAGLDFLVQGPVRLQDYEVSSRLEWLAANGIGGYASGTLAGSNTRRYHGLLVAALTPPTGRIVALSKLEEALTLDGQSIELSANQYPGAVHPQGYRLLERFVPWPAPTFTFRPRRDVCLEKRVWMEYGSNTTFVRYTLLESPGPAGLRITPLTCWKDYHAEMSAASGFPRNLSVASGAGGLELRIGDCGARDAPCLRLLAAGAQWERGDYWHYRLEHLREMERGLEWHEDLYCPGHFLFRLAPGESVTVTATVGVSGAPVPDAHAAWSALVSRQEELLNLAGGGDPYLPALTLAADTFVIPARADSIPAPARSTVIAGYHWFADWGRDTMISLPGLCLSTGRLEVAADIMRSFAQYASEGMLPNRFPDQGQTPEYNTVDAALWYFHAVGEYTRVAGSELARELWPALAEMVDWHLRGTRYGIGVDESDGLLHAGAPGVQLTWMDARIGDWVVTPRAGKPVEINALWHHALRVMAELAPACGANAKPYESLAKRAAASFRKAFVRPDGRGLYDVLTQNGKDAAIRPNQVFAVSLPHSPLSRAQQKRVVETVANALLTPAGLRTLAPEDPAYRGQYRGGPAERDSVYHQGTVWPWLLGPYAEAHLRVYNRPEEARSMLRPLLERLTAQGIGSLSEIADGDPPHTPGGCIAQAWSIAETLRLWKRIERE